MNEYGLTKLCPITVYRWMVRLGFQYKARKKGHYVDRHEKPNTITYRNKFCKRYLQYEVRMFRWIQISKNRSLELIETNIIPKGSGYEYVDADGIAMVKYHIDLCSIF